MTKTPKKDVRKEIVRDFATADLGMIISEGLKSPVSAEKARKAQREYSVGILTSRPIPGTNAPRYASAAQFEALPENEQNQKIVEGLEFGMLDSMETGTVALAKSIDDVVMVEKDGHIKPDNKLLSIANRKPIVESADDKGRAVIEAYLPFAGYKQLSKDLEAGKIVSPKDEEQARKLYNAAQIETVEKAMRKAGRTDRVISAALKLAQITPGEKVEGKELKKGVDRVTKELKADLTKKFGEDFEDKVILSVGKSLKSMLKSGDSEKTQNAASLWYSSQTGYEIGERDYSAVFK